MTAQLVSSETGQSEAAAQEERFTLYIYSFLNLGEKTVQSLVFPQSGDVEKEQ
jgi:hypothetical protein